MIICNKDFDVRSIILQWCKHVNGTTIFPKLPVHIRTYYEKWERNNRVKTATNLMKHDADRLKDLNNTLCPTESLPISENIDTSESTETVGMINIPTLPPLPPIITEIRNVEKPQWIAPRPPQPMKIPDFAWRHSNHFSIVGGSMITRDSFHIDPLVKKKRGQRGKDKKQRIRRCRRCFENNDDRMYTCKGRMGGKSWGVKACQWYTATKDTDV